MAVAASSAGISNCRAYPDEKGIETQDFLIHLQHDVHKNCRAYPDEKGIETRDMANVRRRFRIIAEPIPMKRELKPSSSRATSSLASAFIAEPIPMKRELKR